MVNNISIENAQKELNIKFPKEFINVVSSGAQKKHNIIFLDKFNTVYTSNTEYFLSFDIYYPYEYEQIIFLNKSDKEFIRNNLIAFSLDGGGNYFCFDYRQGKQLLDPPIVFWDHERAGSEDAIISLAPNFKAFLSMLKSEEEADIEYEELKKKYASKE